MSQFTWLPDFPITPSREYKTLVSEFENGAMQYRQKWNEPRNSWRLSFQKRTTVEYNEVRAFFDSMLGRAESFTWTNPLDNVEYTVRFGNDNFEPNINGYNQVDFELILIED